RKLRAGMMPPPGSPRPDRQTIVAFVERLETAIDAAAATRPDPGWRPFQRLNRAEYTAAIRDLFGLVIDASEFLPADPMSAGFDDVADVQAFSPILVTGYLRAADRISRRVISEEAPRRLLLVCRGDGAAAGDEACAKRILRTVTSQAWRGR